MYTFRTVKARGTRQPTIPHVMLANQIASEIKKYWWEIMMSISARASILYNNLWIILFI